MEAKFLKDGNIEEDWYLTFCDHVGFDIMFFDSYEGSFVGEHNQPIDVICYWDLPEVPSEEGK